MKNLHQIMQEIIQLSSNIETNYPELYKYLDETPSKFSKENESDISITDLERYLNTLKEQLSNHLKTHKINNLVSK